MINKIPVSTIMTKEVVTLEPGDLLAEAFNVFNNHNIRHAPVVYKGELKGMLSWIDLKKLPASIFLEKTDEGLENKLLKRMTVRDVMTPDPLSIQVYDSVEELGEMLTENDFHAVPVLDGEKLVGIVSTTDLIRFFLERES